MFDLNRTIEFLASRFFELKLLPWIAGLVLACFKVLRKPQPNPGWQLHDFDVGFDMLIAAIFGMFGSALSLANEMLKDANATPAEMEAMRTAFLNALRLGAGWTLALWALAIAVSEYGWASHTELNRTGVIGPFVVSVVAFLMYGYLLGG